MGIPFNVYIECYHCHGQGTAPVWNGQGYELKTCFVCAGEKRLLRYTVELDFVSDSLQEINDKLDFILENCKWLKEK